jgi:GNAT superfamily N-acetyltransferase
MELKLLARCDINDVYSLFRLCFESNDLIVDFFVWKYFDNPVGEAVLYGFYDGSKLIASGALIPELIHYNDEKIIIYKCTDLMTDPSYRGKGLAKKLVSNLTEIGLQKSGFIYTICSKVATKSFLQSGWTYQDKMIYFFRLPYFNIHFCNMAIKLHKLNLTEIISFFDIPLSVDKTNDLKKQLQWRVQNPKFNYGIYEINIEGVSHFMIYSEIKNTIQLVYFSEYSSKKILNVLFHQLHHDAKMLKKSVISLLPYKTKYFFFFIQKRYFVNLFTFGKMKSILNFNYISEFQDPAFEMFFKSRITMFNYDDL